MRLTTNNKIKLFSGEIFNFRTAMPFSSVTFFWLISLFSNNTTSSGFEFVLMTTGSGIQNVNLLKLGTRLKAFQRQELPQVILFTRLFISLHIITRRVNSGNDK